LNKRIQIFTYYSKYFPSGLIKIRYLVNCTVFISGTFPKLKDATKNGKIMLEHPKKKTDLKGNESEERNERLPL